MTEDQLCRKYACLILWGDGWDELEKLRTFVETGLWAPGRYAAVAARIKDARREEVEEAEG